MTQPTIAGLVDAFGRPATIYTPPEDLRPAPGRIAAVQERVLEVLLQHSPYEIRGHGADGPKIWVCLCSIETGDSRDLMNHQAACASVALLDPTRPLVDLQEATPTPPGANVTVMYDIQSRWRDRDADDWDAYARAASSAAALAALQECRAAFGDRFEFRGVVVTTTRTALVEDAQP